MSDYNQVKYNKNDYNIVNISSHKNTKNKNKIHSDVKTPDTLTELDILKKYTWGFGIEHEMHIYHAPKSIKENITDFILFDSRDVVERIYELLSDDEKKFIDKIPYELSGRKCSNQYVIEPPPILMPEFITFNPFCSIDKKRSLLNMTLEVRQNKEKFYNILKKYDPETNQLIKTYGKLSEYPFGMVRHLKYPVKKNKLQYILNKNNITDYNGSYHLTFTLPHTKKTSNDRFIRMHQNFANQLQWLEPLMLTAFFSGDELAPGSDGSRIRGSFRVMMTGWGNLAGSDVRLFSKGIGRYAKTKTFWRDNLKFKDIERLKLCYPPNPLAIKEKAITSLSSNFRTFGSTDPKHPEHRESGTKMTPPNGVEFRIFDHFPDIHLNSLVSFVSLVAENSRLKKTIGYVYENKIWIDEIHNIMKHGYKTKISKEYIKLLREKLDLKIDTTSIIAFDVFETIYNELWNKNINGKWSKIFNCLDKPVKYEIPEINKESWKFSFCIMLNKNEKLMNKMNNLINDINNRDMIIYKDFKKIVEENMGKRWKADSYDIVYFLNDYSNKLKIIKNTNGTINNIMIKQKINNINNKILNKLIKNDFKF